MLRQQARHGGDVGQPRHVGEAQRIGGEEARRHQRQGGVLRPADGNLADEAAAAVDDDLVQSTLLLRSRATAAADLVTKPRSEEHTSELQSLMRISYAVFCLQNKTPHTTL